MRPRVSTTIVRGLVLIGLFPVVAAAQLPQPGQSLPNVNLGFTTFLDGGPPAGPGFYFQEYVQYYTADRFIGPDRKKLPILDDLDVVVSLNQLIYQSDKQILPGGGRWGIDVIIPIVAIDSDPLRSNDTSIGDILLGPFVQWDPIMGKNGPIFMHRIELQNLLPTGRYSDRDALNPGSNFYSFNPYWAATFFAMPRWTISWRLHWLWNDENESPNKDFFPGASTTKAGEAVHVNFSSAYEVLPHQLRLGVNGYYLEQTSASETDGHNVPNWREKVFALGPGAVYHFSPDDHLFFNAYFETEAQARPEGMRFNFRWTHHF